MSYTDAELYTRGMATLLASWEEIARGSSGAALLRLGGVAAAVFPEQPERTFYNNALLDRDLDAGARAAAVEAMESAYAAAGVDRFAAWVHKTDTAMRAELDHRGYRVDETTLAMGMRLDDVQPGAAGRAPADTGGEPWRPLDEAPEAAVGPGEWDEYLRVLDVPAGLLGGVDAAAFRVVVARLDGEAVAAGMSFDHDGDCGVFNVTTVERARRRGLGRALTAWLVREAAARGCTTASLQSTEMGERVYASVGFRDLGRIFEYVPEV